MIRNNGENTNKPNEKMSNLNEKYNIMEHFENWNKTKNIMLLVFTFTSIK